MNDYEYLRKEIEVRLNRETIFKAIEALNTKASLAKDIAENDKVIAVIGEYLLANGSSWEAFYQQKCK